MILRTPLAACRSALIRRFAALAPHTGLNANGYVGEAPQNLIDGVSLADFEAELLQGDGNELRGKFRAVHSSSALAVNAFAPFKADTAALRLPGGSGFTALAFERKCPHGLAGRRPPNLDVLAEGPSGVVAIESKCLEPLSPHVASFAPDYATERVEQWRGTSWALEMRRLIREPQTYRWLDAAQLVKHAFGIAYTFPQRRATLLYLYWEPANPSAHPFFAEHRGDIARFAASVAGSGPAFAAMSYPELWGMWDAEPHPEWLAIHVRRLRARYAVAIEPAVH